MQNDKHYPQKKWLFECAPCEGGVPAIATTLGPDPTAAAALEWQNAVKELIASRPKRNWRAQTKADAYRLDEPTFDEVDRDYGPAWVMIEQATTMDLWPTDLLAILCEHVSCALQAFPEEEHATRLAYAMRTVGCAHSVDILSFEPGRGCASNEELEARYGVPADKASERAALGPILERLLGKPVHD